MAVKREPEDKTDVVTKTSAGEDISFATQPVLPPQEKDRYVKYVGNSTVRVISKASWLEAGVDDQDDVTWSVSNEFKVPVSDLTEAAVKYCHRDGRFLIADM